MAEIKIEKKKPVWPWILLALVVAALIYYFATREDEPVQDGIETIENTTSTSAVSQPYEAKSPIAA